MFEKPSLVTRIAIGKGAGFAIGLTGVLVMPYVIPDSSWMERLAFLFWYTTLGALVGIIGVFTWHPVLRIPLPWWLNSAMIGAWMNLVLTLFMYDRLNAMMLQIMGASGLLQSPFWFVAEGAIIGLLIGYFATRFGGEGPQTVEPLQRA